MKKTLLLLALSVLVAAFAGCGKTGTAAAWDGTIAKAFAGGKGTEKEPYTIETPAQLAYLAQEVNAGNDFSGKFVSLTRDLDLNNISWTPIGTGTLFFSGTFDGGAHTISNLKITTGAKFRFEYTKGRTLPAYSTGLFADCLNAVIKNLSIKKAEISIDPGYAESNSLYAGIIVGRFNCDTSAGVHNVNVSDAVITVNEFSGKDLPKNLYAGGIIGTVKADKDSSFTLENLAADTVFPLEYSRSTTQHSVGGIIGNTMAYGRFETKNCASYMSVRINPDEFAGIINSFGAFGTVVSATTDTVSFSDIFSKISVNKIPPEADDRYYFSAGAIIGSLYQPNDKSGNDPKGYQFRNLFGWIKQTESETGATAKSMRLYDASRSIPSGLDTVTMSEENCHGCETLPDNCGFDTDIWDISDPSAPKLRW